MAAADSDRGGGRAHKLDLLCGFLGQRAILILNPRHYRARLPHPQAWDFLLQVCVGRRLNRFLGLS